MKLQTKFTIYNTISKILIGFILAVVLPLIVNHVVLLDADGDLDSKKEQVLKIIGEYGIGSFIEDGSDHGYGSYNLLKEEFISLEAVNPEDWSDGIENSERLVENEVVNYRVLSYVFEIDGVHYLLEIGRSLATVQSIENILQNFSLYILIVMVLITTILDIVYTKYLLHPFQQIIQKLKNIKDPSSFKVKKINTSTDDFTYLDDNIDEMMHRIEIAFTKEKEFISNVSHELLTPVSIIQSKLENMLVNNDLSDENIFKIIETQKTLIRLKNIIKALLLISKIENEQYLKVDSIHTGLLIDEVIDEIKERLEFNGITLIKDLDYDFEIKKCNKDLLFILIFNIVNNAIKYNKENGKIIIKSYSTSSGHVLEIKDEGTGMNPMDIPFIFNRFKRLHKLDKDSYGLGLPIVKTIADFHDIEIDVTSVPGQGTSFKLFLKEINVSGLQQPLLSIQQDNLQNVG